jgi:DNA-binding HxlR family transcriptional regulator
MVGSSRTAYYSPDCACCELLARKWTPQVVAVLLGGSRRFSAIHVAIPALSDKVLSRRLTELEQAGIVSRKQYSEIPPRVEYTLTPAGLALEPVIAEMDNWSRRYGREHAGVSSRASPIRASQPS